MRVIKYIVAGLVGFGVGLIVGLGIFFIGDSVSPAAGRIADVIESPVNWLCRLVSPPPSPDGSPAAGSVGWFFFFHFMYWGLLGALIGIGINRLREMGSGSE